MLFSTDVENHFFFVVQVCGETVHDYSTIVHKYPIVAS